MCSVLAKAGLGLKSKEKVWRTTTRVSNFIGSFLFVFYSFPPLG